MEYEVHLKSSAEKELRKLQQSTHDRIINALHTLQKNPRSSGVKKLTGSEGYRIRVGNSRILYTIDDDQHLLEIYSIGHRKKVYR